jgi:hypothetical protein
MAGEDKLMPFEPNASRFRSAGSTSSRNRSARECFEWCVLSYDYRELADPDELAIVCQKRFVSCATQGRALSKSLRSPRRPLPRLSMQSIPDDRAGKTEDVSGHGRDHDERNRRQRIEQLDDVNRLDHVRPENEINDRLCPAGENQQRPK